MNTDSLNKPFRGELLYRAKLAQFTTWRVGGEAEILYRPADADDMACFIAANQDKPITTLGAGSNVLIRDGGIKGVVIITAGSMSHISEIGDLIRVEAGVSCPAFASSCRKKQLAGAEFLSGIPGTIGGAIKMNAGAYGNEIWGMIEKIEVVDGQGQVKELSKEQVQYGYRYCNLAEDNWVVAAYMKLEKAGTEELEEIQAKVKVLQKQRSNTQPLDEYSCGSVFKNPEGDHAARLIDEAGLKGFEIGGAKVSTKHANFIINTGNASAEDIETMIKVVQEKVKQKHGIELETEVKILGEKILDKRLQEKGE